MAKTKPIPRGIRNRSPGNIRYVAGVAFHGIVGPDPDGFCVFDVAENGIRAIAVVLLTYYRKHNIRTIAEAITRWAPSADHNDTKGYIADVAKRTGLKADLDLNFYDPVILGKLVIAIIFHENGVCPYNKQQIVDAVASAIEGNP